MSQSRLDLERAMTDELFWLRGCPDGSHRTRKKLASLCRDYADMHEQSSATTQESLPPVFIDSTGTDANGSPATQE